MPAAPYWEDDYDSWDTVSLGGVVMPGLAKVKASISRKLDVKSVRGRDGARVKDGGYQPGKITIEIRTTTREEFDALQPRLDAINPRQRGTSRSAVDIAHPSLAFLGISAVYIEKVGAPELVSGILTTSIECLEWTPQPRARPSGAGAQTGAATPDTVEQREARARQRAVPGTGPIGSG